VAHELKSPLAAIRGAAAAFGRPEQLTDEDRDELVRVIVDASAQADRLVADVLLAGRLGAGHLPVSVRETDIAPAVEAVARAAAAAYENVTVRTHFRDGVRPLAMADPDRLRAVLANLVDNAIVHGPEGGAIEIVTSVEAGRVRLAVADEGSGVPAGDRERIFEPYVRLTERTAGTGLGLHLARQLARAMGGDVMLEPAGGPGTTFVLELPAVEAAPL
jgi:two-component system sensor histidine kinase KdpD